MYRVGSLNLLEKELFKAFNGVLPQAQTNEIEEGWPETEDAYPTISYGICHLAAHAFRTHPMPKAEGFIENIADNTTLKHLNW